MSKKEIKPLRGSLGARLLYIGSIEKVKFEIGGLARQEKMEKVFPGRGFEREKVLRWERTWQGSEGQREALMSERQLPMWNLVGAKKLETTGRFFKERINDFKTLTQP